MFLQKSGGFIDSSSAMAAMVEVFKDQVAHIDSLELQGIKSLPVSLCFILYKNLRLPTT